MTNSCALRADPKNQGVVHGVGHPNSGTSNYVLRLESDAIDFDVNSLTHVREILVVDLSLRKREIMVQCTVPCTVVLKSQGVTHCVIHPSFDRAVKRFIHAYRMSVSAASQSDMFA